MILDDLREWVIAYTGPAGQGFVGRPFASKPGDEAFASIRTIALEPVYVLASGYVITPQGQLARPMILFPLELLVASIPLRVTYHALLNLRELDASDFKALARTLVSGIEQAEAMRAGIRTSRSGIVLAPGGSV